MQTKILKLAAIIGGSIGLAYLGNRLYKHRQVMLTEANNSACNTIESRGERTITNDIQNAPSPLQTPVEGTYETHMVDYSKITPIRPLEEEEDIDQEFLEELKEPHMISIDDFDTGYPERYGTESLTYYVVDDILANGEDEMINDVESLIGADALDHFGAEAAELSGDSETMYIRNEKLHCDYEVTRIHQSYHQVVLGE